MAGHAAPHVSLTRILSPLIPVAVRRRGAEYFMAGRVTQVETRERRVHALVLGSRVYQVEIELGESGRLPRVSCTCPYYDGNGYCKHVWAAVLESAAQNAALVSRGSVDDIAREMDRAMDSYAQQRAGRATPRAETRDLQQAKARPAWQRRLEALRAGPPIGAFPSPERGWPAGRRIVYHLDLDSAAYGDLTVAIKLDRSPGAPKTKGSGNLALTEDLWLRAPDSDDREIAQMLLGAREEWQRRNQSATRRRYAIAPSSYGTLLRRICLTGRCHVVSATVGISDAGPVVWDDGPPWQLILRVVCDEATGGWRAEPILRRADEEMPFQATLGLTASGLVISANRIARFVDTDSVGLVSSLLHPEPLVVPEDKLFELAASLLALPSSPPVELPPGTRLDELRPEPEIRLRLKPAPSTEFPFGSLLADLSFTYAGAEVGFLKPGRALVDRGQRRLIHRRPDLERQARERLMSLGAAPMYTWKGGGQRLVLPAVALDQTVRALTAEGWRVEASGRHYRAPIATNIELRTGVDWFELEGWVDYAGQRVSLPRLFAAARRGERTVLLDDGTAGVLPDEWLARHAGIVSLGTGAETDAVVRFTRPQAALLDVLLATLPEARTDETFERIRQELRTFSGVAAEDAPPGFSGTLRPYQRDGLGWMAFLRRFGVAGCLADDMGLGKTVQILAMLEGRRADGAGPSLVVVPRSLVFNWRQEAARFTPSLRVLEHTGTQRRRRGLDPSSFDVLLTTYGTLRRDAAQLRDVEFEYAILDEAQAIKNAGTASAKAARLLRARHRLALSGTPIENRLSELWSLFEFLNPGMLGSASALSALQPETSAGPPNDGSRALLARALRPFLLRRTKEQVAGDLPPKLEQTVFVELEPPQRALYNELRDHYRHALLRRVDRTGIGRARLQILEALLRMRQAACHPGLIDQARAADPSAKLDVLLAQLAEIVAEGHKALVFSQFTSLLALVKTRLDAQRITYEYLDGKTRDRQARVERFQREPACPVFLISLKAGGQGLNLTAADYVFILDPWWNPAVEAQAVDRTHRIGQTKSVFAIRLIVRDTVEEKVLELQRTKRELADAILTADQGVISRIGREELELLLG